LLTSAPNYRICANIFERCVYVLTDKDVDVYRVEPTDLVFEKTFPGTCSHSIFVVGSLTIIQEQYTNNMKIINNGVLYRSFKGLGASPPRSTSPSP
jgi:hypothetical protein